MSQLKRLSGQQSTLSQSNPTVKPAAQPTNRLGVSDGFNFGLGFMAAAFVFYIIVIPLTICASLVFGGSLISALAGG